MSERDYVVANRDGWTTANREYTDAQADAPRAAARWADGSSEFHLGHGDMISVPRDTGFEVEALIELFASEEAKPHPYSYATADGARQWPAEEIWAARTPA